MVSVWLFGERIKRPSVLDAACILVGIVTISSSQSRA
jgi:multidrug transporter EmrE-like cation transporter